MCPLRVPADGKRRDHQQGTASHLGAIFTSFVCSALNMCYKEGIKETKLSCEYSSLVEI